jgi:hypothetical protein
LLPHSTNRTLEDYVNRSPLAGGFCLLSVVYRIATHAVEFDLCKYVSCGMMVIWLEQDEHERKYLIAPYDSMQS